MRSLHAQQSFFSLTGATLSHERVPCRISTSRSAGRSSGAANGADPASDTTAGPRHAAALAVQLSGALWRRPFALQAALRITDCMEGPSAPPLCLHLLTRFLLQMQRNSPLHGLLGQKSHLMTKNRVFNPLLIGAGIHSLSFFLSLLLPSERPCCCCCCWASVKHSQHEEE